MTLSLWGVEEIVWNCCEARSPVGTRDWFMKMSTLIRARWKDPLFNIVGSKAEYAQVVFQYMLLKSHDSPFLTGAFPLERLSPRIRLSSVSLFVTLLMLLPFVILRRHLLTKTTSFLSFTSRCTTASRLLCTSVLYVDVVERTVRYALLLLVSEESKLSKIIWRKSR